MHHILLVDDDINFRRSLVIQLEMAGYQVSEAEGGEQALNILKKVHGKQFPELVITDFRMPEMDGEQFVRELRKQHPKMPVVVISAYEPPDTMMSDAFLRKPFRIGEMNDCMTRLFSHQ
jgi:DNA-binding NtrC family response regulator